MGSIRKNYNGITIIEIVVVLIIFSFIISISSTVIMPQNSSIKNKLEILDIYSDVCDTRNMAMTNLIPTRVRFIQNFNNTGNSAYVLQKNHNNMWQTYKRIILPAHIKIYSIIFPGNNINQSFSFLGVPSYSGSVTILVREKDMYQLVFYSSGRIRVKQIEK